MLRLVQRGVQPTSRRETRSKWSSSASSSSHNRSMATTTAAVVATSAAAMIFTSSEVDGNQFVYDSNKRKNLYSRHVETNLNSHNKEVHTNYPVERYVKPSMNFVLCEAEQSVPQTHSAANQNQETSTPESTSTSNALDTNITFRQRRLTLNTSSLNDGISKQENENESNKQASNNDASSKSKAASATTTLTTSMKIMYSTEIDKSEESFSPKILSNSSTTELPFPSHQVGTYSCHGVEPHPYVVYTKNEKPIDINAMSFFDRIFGTKANETYTSAKVVTVSQRKINQDRGHIIHPYGQHDRTALFGVFDGHGICGEMLAEYTMNAVFEKLNAHLNFNKHRIIDNEGVNGNDENVNVNIKQAFADIFQEIDNEVKEKAYLKSAHSGSTACVVLVCEDKVWAANVGDSRAVAARRSSSNSKDYRTGKKRSSINKLKAVDWSKDQNAHDKAERLRVIQSGGFVTLPHEEGLPARIWLDKDCTQIGLAMSRSIGDHALKGAGVISDPEVKEFKITDEDEFFIIATDGVWEFITSDDAVEIIQRCFDAGMGASDACEVLIKEAMERWKDMEGDYRDDITAIIVKLKGLWDEHA